ncbi:MAG: hypothetical protein ACYDAN_08195 [Candidatus Limnocylindrales bacterium]
MTFEAFALSVLASTVAALLLFVAGALYSRRGRSVLIELLGRLLSFDLEEVFPSSAHAHASIQHSLSRSSSLRILVGRGNELQLPVFAEQLAKPSRRGRRTRVLLPAVDPAKGFFDWTSQRERELRQFDNAFDGALLRQQIEANAAFIRGRGSSQVEIRRYESPHFGRLIITERDAHLTFYRSDTHGRESQVYKYRRGDFYDGLCRLFELIWEASEADEAALSQSSARKEPRARSRRSGDGGQTLSLSGKSRSREQSAAGEVN